MRIIGVMVFLAGMVMFASGLVFLDLASLPLKNDLYSIDVLGFFNNMFSLNPSLATMQTVLSGLFVLMGCFICFSRFGS
jgi:flagellar biosynthesis protein FlhB